MSLVFDTSLYMNGMPGGGVSLDKIIVKSDTIPAAAAKYVGAVYQYVGATNATYTHGYIYECVESGSTYAWERIDVQPGATRGRFLALWNCATGLAESNPPSSPYPYGVGDYYIVGTVGTTNYKPSGSSYVIGTASTTVETDDVAVNDTYYYDGTNWNLQKNTATTVDQNYDPTSPKAQSGVAIAGASFQTTTNLVTSVSSASTDTQYPSAKLLYDTVGNIEATLDAIIAQGSNS